MRTLEDALKNAARLEKEISELVFPSAEDIDIILLARALAANKEKTGTDRRMLDDKLVELIAISLDSYERQVTGNWQVGQDNEGIKRYTGIDLINLPPHAIVINPFRNLVDMMVSQINIAINDSEE